MSDIYDFTLYDRKGNAYPLSEYKGRARSNTTRSSPR